MIRKRRKKVEANPATAKILASIGDGNNGDYGVTFIWGVTGCGTGNNTSSKEIKKEIEKTKKTTEEAVEIIN